MRRIMGTGPAGSRWEGRGGEGGGTPVLTRLGEDEMTPRLRVKMLKNTGERRKRMKQGRNQKEEASASRQAV